MAHTRDGEVRGDDGGHRSRVRTASAVFAVGAALGVLGAGCSSSSKYGSSSSSAGAVPPLATTGPTTTASSGAATVALRSSKLGMIMTDAGGMTLYTFDKDQLGASVSACTGACAARWPALTVSSTPTAASGLPGTLTTIPASGTAPQVAWNGKLLYRYAADHAPGDTNGEGVGGIWHAAQPASSGSAPTTATTLSVVGGY